MNYPKIKMNTEYRMVKTNHPVRILTTDLKHESHPVLAAYHLNEKEYLLRLTPYGFVNLSDNEPCIYEYNVLDYLKIDDLIWAWNENTQDYTIPYHFAQRAESSNKIFVFSSGTTSKTSKHWATVNKLTFIENFKFDDEVWRRINETNYY